MADKKTSQDAQDFKGILDRLQEIATQVEGEDTALETSMDLLNEAVELGTRATQIIDDENLSEEEKQKLQEMLSDEDSVAEFEEEDDDESASDKSADKEDAPIEDGFVETDVDSTPSADGDGMVPEGGDEA